MVAPQALVAESDLRPLFDQSQISASLGPMGLYRWSQTGEQLGVLSHVRARGIWLFQDLPSAGANQVQRHFGLTADGEFWGIGQIHHLDWHRLGLTRHEVGWHTRVLATWSTYRPLVSEAFLRIRLNFGLALGSEHRWDVLEDQTFLYEVKIPPALVFSGDASVVGKGLGLTFGWEIRTAPFLPYGLDFIREAEWLVGSSLDLGGTIGLTFPMFAAITQFVVLEGRGLLRVIWGDADYSANVTWSGADVSIRYGITFHPEELN